MVEIIPKPPARIPTWQNFLFYLSIFLLVASLLGYFLLYNSHKEAKLELKKLEEILEREKTEEEREIEEKVKETKRKIDEFSRLFERHRYASNFFKVLEEFTHPRVQLTSLGLDLGATTTASISARTDSFQIVSQQLKIFKEAKEEFQEISLSELALVEEGGVRFDFKLILNPKIFIQQ